MTKSRTLLIIVALLASSGVAQVRSTISFDNDWLFQKADVESGNLADATFRKLDVPHDWSIEGPFDAKNPTAGAGGYLPSGVGWYRKHFRIAADQKGKHVFIEFDGVMANSDVWINGFHLGKRPNGYVSFGYELTDKLKLGGDNVITVRADNSGQPASRWYTGAGIYRHIRLVTTNALHLEKWSTFVTTPQVNANEATIKIATKISNQSEKNVPTTVEYKILDSNGKVVARTESGAVAVESGETGVVDSELKVANPALWSLETPNLYKAVVTVLSNGKPIDSETVSFGIRSFEFVPATGFWLNGKNFKIKGACLHHDGSAFGVAVPLAVWERRLNELRKLGVNAIRTAHNPPSPEFLDLTDRMGFLVMDELFDQWTGAKNPFDYHKDFPEWSKIDVADTVRRDRNHPSVIIYSAGNEIRDNHADQEKAKATLRGLVDTFHANDPTRPVTQALFRPNIEGARDYDNGLAEILDVVGQNYREKEILAAYKQKPTRKILGTENTHDLNQWLALRDHPEYSGQFIWVGVDYLGESAAWPNYAYGKGLLDRTAMPRPVSYQRQSWWSDKPMVYIARRVAPAIASPTDPGYEVAEQKRTQTLFGDWTPKNLGPHEENAEIYSNCDEVELFLNGKSLGSKSKPVDDSPRNWKVNFESGTINAVGKNGVKVVAEFELKTAGRPAKIILSADKTKIANDWNDVVYVEATVVDANGVVVPSANDMISFATSGSGIVAAVDSADNADHDPFQASQRHAFQGRCIALIKANKSTGQITVTASAPGLAGAKITIGVKA
ncbi:MAG: glycoside hydrolase family 2 [Acidobacteria bacterium]|nr:MAG: glycoside hydrolase family 2 [Acidobacteriota bacterium]